MVDTLIPDKIQATGASTSIKRTITPYKEIAKTKTMLVLLRFKTKWFPFPKFLSEQK
jgi:hypothetical protein